MKAALFLALLFALPFTSYAEELNEEGFRKWIAQFRERALAAGVSAKTFDAGFAGIKLSGDVLERQTNQAEHVRSVGVYLEGALREERMTLGREMLGLHAALLARVERETGVDRHVVLAIWGLESTFGTGMGTRNIYSSLGTQAYANGRRVSFAERQMIAALKLMEAEQLAPETMIGSWAGAVGHTQFMPTTYLAYAVDGDGDGRRDLWRSLPDALMSAGRYLERSQWQRGVRWGVPVLLPDGFDYTLSGLGKWRSLAQWTADGVRASSGDFSRLGRDATLILPSGHRGPAYLVSRNFRALLRYNNATKYALAVGYLSDAFSGLKVNIGKWPESERHLSREEAFGIQRKLTDLGHDTGGVDGIIGTKSRRAIQAFQSKLGVPADGFLDQALINAIMESKPDKNSVEVDKRAARARLNRP